jgi:hypothetical protein
MWLLLRCGAPDTAGAPLMWGSAGNEQVMAKITACQLHVFYDQI